MADTARMWLRFFFFILRHRCSTRRTCVDILEWKFDRRQVAIWILTLVVEIGGHRTVWKVVLWGGGWGGRGGRSER
jgi:hypothetical protein